MYGVGDAVVPVKGDEAVGLPVLVVDDEKLPV